MSMQHINKESGLSMFVKIHEVDIEATQQSISSKVSRISFVLSLISF